MIYVKIELWPGGDKNRATLIAEAKIANISNLAPQSDYRYELTGKAKSPMGSGFVRSFPRKRLMAWDLLYRVLRDARGKRNGDDPTEGLEDV